VPRARRRRRAGAANLQQRSDATPSREIATKVSPRARAIVLLDQVGWHGTKMLKAPSNVSLMPLPPRTPEHNGQENIWQFARHNWRSIGVFKCFDDIVDTAATLGAPD
jgi:hypothetical protein